MQWFFLNAMISNNFFKAREWPCFCRPWNIDVAVVLTRRKLALLNLSWIFFSFFHVKKAEHWRIDAFELWCWRRLLRVPWTARRSNQSILKVITPGISLEGLMLKLKLQYFGNLMRRVDSLEKTLMLGGIGGRRRRGRQRMRGWMASLTRWTWIWVNSGSWWWTGRPGVLRFMGLQRVGHDWETELNWTEFYSLGSHNINWFSAWCCQAEWCSGESTALG